MRYFTNSRIEIFSAKHLLECGALTGTLLAPTFGPRPDICHAVLLCKFGGALSVTVGAVSERNRCFDLGFLFQPIPAHHRPGISLSDIIISYNKSHIFL